MNRVTESPPIDTVSITNSIATKDSNSFSQCNNSMQTVGHRGLTVDTMRKYGILTEVTPDGTPIKHHYPYGNGAFKVRDLRQKNFYATGLMSERSLFGADVFPRGFSRSVTLGEGELDAGSIYQMLGGVHAVVSLRSSASVEDDIARQIDYLNSFDKIYLCFDMDEPGQEAAKKAARFFDVNKVYFVDMDRHVDANDYLMAGEIDEFRDCWFGAKKFRPKGILTDWGQIEELLMEPEAEQIGTYPFEKLNEISYGIRSKEVNLFMAHTKVGKTEVMRAIEVHLLRTTDLSIGCIHMEEREKRGVQGIASYELRQPCHLPNSNVSREEVLAAYKKVTKTEGRHHIYQHFGTDDPDAILDVIRYLVTVCGCKVIFLDHITRLATAYEGNDERKRLDYLSTKLSQMVIDLDFCLMLVSHVNDDGKTRGSRNIANEANLLVYIWRDKEAVDIEVRNTVTVTVRGNRFGADTGPSTPLWFDRDTFILEEKNESLASVSETGFPKEGNGDGRITAPISKIESIQDAPIQGGEGSPPWDTTFN